jgi:hypothetical protein
MLLATRAPQLTQESDGLKQMQVREYLLDEPAPRIVSFYAGTKIQCPGLYHRRARQFRVVTICSSTFPVLSRKAKSFLFAPGITARAG